MLHRKQDVVIPSLFIFIISFPWTAFGQGPPRGSPEARALELMDLLGSIEGEAREPPRLHKTAEGYLRFIGAPPSTHFPVEPGKHGTPQEAADAFLERWRDLFVRESPSVGLKIVF